MRWVMPVLMLLMPAFAQAEEDLHDIEREYALAVEKATTRYVTRMDAAKREMLMRLKEGHEAARARKDTGAIAAFQARIAQLDAAGDEMQVPGMAQTKPITVVTTAPLPAKASAPKMGAPLPVDLVVEKPVVPPATIANGLIVREYARHQTQMADAGGYVPLADLGEPFRKPLVAKTLAKWKFTDGRNCSASGLLKITKPGDYYFQSSSFYDRNVLMINNKEVCTYRDGETRVHRVTLPAGYIPITIIGYVNARGSVQVSWMPPGDAELTPLPDALLFHDAADMPAVPNKKNKNDGPPGAVTNPEFKGELF